MEGEDGYGLIEAYWNVNTQIKFRDGISREGLIEAYWNVNFHQSDNSANMQHGLIEAYWNVNLQARSSAPVQSRFNRSILKCKC